mmetsp:Transcript_17482/g.35789  ORF Transcript_17482/g.35789 Transcript_17482/m.35789 type:complete len:248 (+) Transcript_17482:135-878(+)
MREAEDGDVESDGGVGRDGAGVALTPVRQRRRYNQPSLAADADALEPDVIALNHLPGPELEHILPLVEYGAVRELADVSHRDCVALLDLLSRANLEVRDLESEVTLRVRNREALHVRVRQYLAPVPAIRTGTGESAFRGVDGLEVANALGRVVGVSPARSVLVTRLLTRLAQPRFVAVEFAPKRPRLPHQAVPTWQIPDVPLASLHHLAPKLVERFGSGLVCCFGGEGGEEPPEGVRKLPPNLSSVC